MMKFRRGIPEKPILTALPAAILVLIAGCQPFMQNTGSAESVSRESSAKPNQKLDVTGFTPEAIIWEGQSHGFDIRWTTSDLSVVRPDRSRYQDTPDVKVFSNLATSYFNSILEGGENAANQGACFAKHPGECFLAREFSVVSVFGPFLTFTDEFSAYSGKGSEPNDARVTTINLEFLDRPIYIVRDGQPTMTAGDESSTCSVSLYDLFDSEEIVKELVKIPAIEETFDHYEIIYKGRTAHEISQQIKESVHSPLLTNADRHLIVDDFFTRFIIEKVYDNGKAMVLIVLPASGGYTAGAATLIRLELSIPSEIREEFANASRGTVGFFGNFTPNTEKPRTRVHIDL